MLRKCDHAARRVVLLKYAAVKRVSARGDFDERLAVATELEQMPRVLQRKGYDTGCDVCSVVVYLIGLLRFTKIARRVFDARRALLQKRRSTPSQHVYSAMIAAYGRNARLLPLSEFLALAQGDGVRLAVTDWISIARAYSASGKPETALRILQQRSRQKGAADPGIEKGPLDLTGLNDFQRNFAISLLPTIQEALGACRLEGASPVPVTAATLVALLTVCKNAGDFAGTGAVRSLASARGLELDQKCYTLILAAAARAVGGGACPAGVDLRRVKNVWSEMKSQGYPPDAHSIVAYLSALRAFALQGHEAAPAAQADEIFRTAERVHAKAMQSGLTRHRAMHALMAHVAVACGERPFAETVARDFVALHQLEMDEKFKIWFSRIGLLEAHFAAGKQLDTSKRIDNVFSNS
ncbi:hypothetical protein DIPPA_09164 [Diplonema papillatum]|nr:hypothetical protein DIPPA_09164 [Diplonema papillatum]|eukprot:gene2061-3153_t